MTIIGVTGHQTMPNEAVMFAVCGIRALLSSAQPPLVGMSSLAMGADQLFAAEVIAAGGLLHAVIPAAEYESTFSGSNKDSYRSLLIDAARTTELPFPQPDEIAFQAAGYWIAEHCEILVAVWDGQPARGLGGTADVVGRAQQLGRSVHVIWPDGLQRS